MKFFEISLDTANQFYAWGWRASIVGALITFFGVGFLYWGTRIRDHDVESQVAALNSEAGKAMERAGKLEERAAISEERSKILEQGNLTLQRDLERERIDRLKLEEKVAARRLSGEQTKKMVEILSAATPLNIVVVSRLLDPGLTDFLYQRDRETITLGRPDPAVA